MTNSNNFSNRIAAAVSALALSLVLITGTVSTPSVAQAHGASAYVGAIA